MVLVLMNSFYSKGKIPPYYLFFLLTVSRLVVVMTFIQSLSYSKINNDYFISHLIGFAVTLLMSVPAILCISLKKNPLKNKIISRIYFPYTVFLSAIDTARFSSFSATRINSQHSSIIFTILILLACAYGAYLGIEALGRFSGFAFAVLIMGIVLLIAFNIPNFEFINLFPLIESSNTQIIERAFKTTSNTNEIIVYLIIADKLTEKSNKPFVLSVSSSYIISLCVMICALGVLGDYISTQTFPIYALSQMASLRGFGRLDAIHTAVWIFASFIKLSLMIYCSMKCLKIKSNKLSCLICTVLTLAVSIIFSNSMLSSQKGLSPTVLFIIFALFNTVIPLISLFVKKRNYGDELLENY